MERTSPSWFFKKLQDDNQCLLYNGSFSDKITYKIVDLSEANLKHQKEGFKTQRRVSYLMAECFQNIIRHGNETNNKIHTDQNSNFFMTRNSKGRYYILSGNLIKDENIESLKGQLDQLNKLNDEELKALHKQVMKYGKISEKGGAGLGLIEMARKSGHKLGYLFKKYNQNSSIFYNQIILNSEVEPDESNNSNLGIESAIELHNLLIKKNILMVQKGDFSQESIIPVLNIIERSIINTGSKSMVTKNIYRTMVELLQNISKHAYSTNEFKEGIFLLAKSNDKYTISAGNYIHNKDIAKLEEHLDKINTSNKDELENWYSELLMNELENDNIDAGLGIIDLAQLLTEKIKFDFEPFDNEKSFFSISIHI